VDGTTLVFDSKQSVAVGFPQAALTMTELGKQLSVSDPVKKAGQAPRAAPGQLQLQRLAGSGGIGFFGDPFATGCDVEIVEHHDWLRGPRTALLLRKVKPGTAARPQHHRLTAFLGQQTVIPTILPSAAIARLRFRPPSPAGAIPAAWRHARRGQPGSLRHHPLDRDCVSADQRAEVRRRVLVDPTQVRRVRHLLAASLQRTEVLFALVVTPSDRS